MTSLLVLLCLQGPVLAGSTVPSVGDAVALAPGGVTGLALVERFVLDTAYAYEWRADHPELGEGTILVVEVEPTMSVPRAVGQPVLYVGETPAERVSWGANDRRMVVVVPGRPDLSVTPVYFGSDMLPERVDLQVGAAELAAAVASGATPFSVEQVAEARAPDSRFADRAALQRHLADLLTEHCPDDAARGEGWKLPMP